MTPTKKKRSVDECLDDLTDRIDCNNRSLSTLRGDIVAIVRDAVLETMKEHERRKYVEVGYKG